METAGATYTLDEYEALFTGVTSERAVGEKSPIYLTNQHAPLRIKALIPDVRLLAVLRNPVDRAFSHYLMNVRMQLETLPFADAVMAERDNQPIRAGVVRHYVRSGKYAAPIERYMELFGPEQLRIYLYEDLLTNGGAIVREIYEYLGVDPNFTPNLTVHHNARPSEDRGRQLVSRIHSLGRRVAKRDLRRSSSGRIPSSTRRELSSFFREDILHLQGLLGRDLSGWLA
jgi:hypothetical protein